MQVIRQLRLKPSKSKHFCILLDRHLIDYQDSNQLLSLDLGMNERPKHLPADERRAVTVEAVINLAAEKNPSEITTKAIAERMGLTQGAIFRHFPNKEAILQAVMTWVSKRLLERVDKAIKGIDSPAAALEAVFLAHIDFIAELQRQEQSLPKRMVQTLLMHYRERVRGLLEKGKAQGEFSAELNVDAAVMLFVGSIQGLVMQSLLLGDVAGIRSDAPDIFAIYRHGLGVADPTTHDKDAIL